MAWCGPEDVSAPCSGTSYFTTSTGDAIPANSPLKTGGDDQYFQYKITLASSGFATPTVTNASVQYEYNIAPVISSVTYTQNANGTVTVPYTLSETYDDLGNIAHGTNSAPIKVLLFWQPDSGVTAPVLTDAQTGIITLTNTNSQPIPTSGSMLIDTELITFDSAGCTGNQRNVLTRGATFDTAFPTTAASHSAGTAVFFKSSSAVQTVNTFSATGTPGDSVATSGNSFVWDPRNDSNSNLNTNKLTGLLLKVVANDADATNFNTIGQSSVTAAQTLDLQLPTFTVQYYSDSGLTNSLGDNPKLKAGTYYIKISASEALTAAPTISIAAEGTANDVTSAATTFVSGNDYRYTRTIATDVAAVGTALENISLTGTDNFSNASTNVDPTNESNKAGYTDTNAPTFTMQYYSDSGLTSSLGNNPKLKAGTYYIKISASEALAAAPTISIAAEGTANDVTDAATTLVSGNDYRYTRVVASDASAVGTTIENFSVTGTDNFSNASTNANPTDEATKAGYTDTVLPTSPGTATLNSYLNNTGNQTVSWTQVTEASFQDYLVQRKTGVGGTFATVGSPITNIATVSYADNSALAEGTYYYQVIAEDTAGNTATSATSSVLTVDKTAPILQSFTSSSTNSDPDDPLTMYGTGDTINIQAVFNENLASGSTMTVELENTARSQVVLNQISGSTLYGTYTVSGPHDGISDDSIDLAVRRVVSMSVSDLATNLKSSESVPTGQNLSDNKDIIVDTVPPSLQSFSATAGNYNAGDSITLTAHYNKSVKAGSNIHVKVNSDGGTATIDMTTVSTSTISGPYVVQSGDNVQNLKVASIVSQAVSDIKNNQLTDTIMPSTNISDGVLVDTTAPVITFTNDVDSGPTQSDEVTINVSEINPSSHKYIFSADNVCNTKNYTSATSFGSDTPITFIAETNNTKYICTKSVDTAGNESYAASANPLNIDITHPTGTILINRSLDSGQIQLTAADGSRDITGLQMRSVIYDNDTTACDLSGASWGDFAATLDLVSDSGFVKACVEYRDVAGNTTIISATPPQTPESFQYYDVSDPDDFRLFLSWRIPTGHEGSKGFYQYQLFQCLDDKDNAECTINTAGAPDIIISQESTNYKNYLGLSNENKYCYQIRFASHDADGTDYSEFSDKKCVIPSSGGSSVTKDLAILFPADPVPDAEIFANQVTIHWDTVNANDPSELLPADSQVCWRVHLPEPPGWNCRSFESYETSHTVTISKATNQIYDLVPDTEYEYQVHSETSWGKEATLDGPATFTTKNGPVIKNINADPIGNSTATIRWTTENKDGNDLASSSSLWYSSTLDEEGDLVTPKAAACDSTDVISHTCTLSDLSIGTQYYYYVESTANSATARDTASGAFYRFTTLSDSTPPVITANPDNPLITTDTQAAISWETNERSNSWLLYDTANHAAFDNFTDTDFDPTIVLRNPYASYLAGGSSNLTHNFIMSLNSLEPSTTYYYRLVSQDTSENVSVSQEYSFTTLPIQTDHPDLTNPGNPVVAEYSDTEAVIYLPAANTDSTSKICWDTEVITDVDNCADYSEISTATKSHFYHVTGLTPDTDYHVMTKITDSETPGINFTSEDVTFTTEKIQIDQHEPLSEITDISDPPSVITDTKAVITFDTDQVAQCSIEYGTETGNYSEVPFVESSFNVNHSIHMTGLIFSTAYFYQIACIDDLGNTEESDEYTFTTLDKQLGEGEYNALQDATAPEISSVKVDSVTGETAVIIWNTDEEASSSVGFGIESGKLDKMAGNYLTNMDKENYSKTHTVTISGLIPSTKYYYKASSLDASGNIGESSEGSFTTSEPSSLSSVKVESNKMGEATITWTTGNKATSIVEYGLTTSYGDKKEKTDYVEEHSIELSGLNQGETYHYRVKGEDEDGNLYASSDNTFEPKSPPKIENIVVSDVTENGAVVSFTTDVLTDANVIYTDADNSTETGSQGTQELSTKHKITLTNLKQGTTYRISVSAKDEFGSESRMEAKDFTTGKDENPPNIESVHTDSALTQSDKVQTIISWKTNEQATSVVIFREGRGGSEVDYKNTDSLSTNHVVVMPALKAGTVYNFRVKSADAAGNESVSQYFSFLTPRTKENIIQIIINNFTEIFGWTGNVGVKK
ncbi:MAG TPA: fibronectin type III domain-containing protein [Candidatus Moranbacteria bacterium]|nr:fibronectin type III domain-containing protein [Candidatus Moranbacteria bacterium]